MAKIQNTYLNKEGLGSFLSNLKKIFLGTKTITSAVDWNTLTENGVYHIKTTAGTNRPVTNWGMLYVEGETATKFQIFIPDVKNNVIYKRYENAGWKDWQELTLIETSGEVYDTGWKSVECGYGISAWSTTDAPKIRRVGKTVELVGIITNSTSFADHDSLFRNIPEDMRPSRNVWSIQQGDIKNKTTARWMMTINPGGTVSFNYYGFLFLFHFRPVRDMPCINVQNHPKPQLIYAPELCTVFPACISCYAKLQ